MPEKPDFIVDPYGNVRDVRRQKYSPEPSTTSPQTSAPNITTSRVHTHSSHSAKSAPDGAVFFPIILIVSVITAILRYLPQSTPINYYPEPNLRTVDLGLDYYDQGNYEMAIDYFTIAIAKETDTGEAYNDRGLAYLAIGEIDKAIIDFDKAIELLPDPAAAYNNRGNAYFTKGNHEQAMVDLEKAIELSPNLAKAYYNRGLTYLDLGNYDLAIADFDKAIELSPETTYYFSATAEAIKSTLEIPVSGDIFGASLFGETETDLAAIYAVRAMAYLLKGDYQKAVFDYEKATQFDLDPAFAQQVEALLADFKLDALPNITVVPQAGRWEGSANSGDYSGPVSFNVSNDGQINDFILTLVLGPDNSCLVDSQNVYVEPDGTFSFTFTSNSRGSGLFVQGAFVSNTLVNGVFSGNIFYPPNQLNSGQVHSDSWSAHWVSDP
ncbi:MAG: tetratricopeptide repeat protein [Anaerolineaceae bacterium]|nr:tetratricopeptide repeat protein [Anaerolineaceae bacterium]